jgi:hypothetical protein
MLVFTQAPPHTVCPVGHTQAPAEQLSPEGHVVPHALQLAGSVCRFTQVPLQLVSPA